MKYDINLKKTQLGYQFDRNVFIGYQTNDNRVVTVKELKGYIGGSGGGGGGGGGGIQSITLGGGNGVVTLQVDQSEPQSITVTNVVAEGTIPDDADPYVCVIAPVGTGYKVYPTNVTWSQLTDSIPEISWEGDNSHVLSVTVNDETHSPVTHSLTLGNGLVKSSSGNTTTLSIDNTVVRGLSITNNGLNYTDGSGTHSLGSSIGTTPVLTLSLATRSTPSPSDSDVVTVGYLDEHFQGGNVYSTEETPQGQQTSDKNTRFIFVEVE